VVASPPVQVPVMAVMPALSLDVPVELIKDPRSWTEEEVSVWLRWLGIGEHAEAFLARRVDGRALLQLSADSSWSEFGVVDPAQQRVLESAVEPLRCFHDMEGADTALGFHAIEGPVAGEVFFVGAGGITGGRHSASNGIVLSENYVSRRHFLITRDLAGQHLLQDVGSTTGTFLMVKETLPLADLMVLQLGTTELTVHLESDECTLVATEGPDKDIRAVVQPQGLRIGRESSNGLCIRDPQISSLHAEVRRVADQGFVLDDQYSTNRTWLRLSPDGQPSRRFPLRIGDLFKVGSTLFHVVDPSSLPDAALGNVAVSGQARSASIAMAASVATRSSVQECEDAEPEDSLHTWSDVTPTLREDAMQGTRISPTATLLNTSSSRGPDSSQLPSSQIHWEPFIDGELRPVLLAEEYARRVTASRRRMVAEGSARQAGAMQSNLVDLHDRELTSLQQRMCNSRAQTAYTLQQQRQAERRDEDLCKICYDRDIDVVLYPCGHFILCRWCAQKVSDCPVCRFVITDVVRTYKA